MTSERIEWLKAYRIRNALLLREKSKAFNDSHKEYLASYRQSHREERISYNRARYRDSHENVGVVVCSLCNGVSPRIPSRQKYCSRKCKSLAKYSFIRERLRVAIDQGLLDPKFFNGYGKEWPLISLRIRQRDNYTCQSCGDFNAKLHVHHIFEFEQGGSHDDDNLITLCASCHTRGHQTNIFFLAA